jgi:hypothetical protein
MSVGQVHKKYRDVSSGVHDGCRQNAAALLHHKTEQQAFDQRQEQKERQAPTVLDLNMERAEGVTGSSWAPAE